jgi:NADH-quinone oxidoreductase subunit M
MLDQLPILSAITFLPTLGAVAILVLRALMRGEDALLLDRNAKGVALFVTLVVLALSVLSGARIRRQPGRLSIRRKRAVAG